MNSLPSSQLVMINDTPSPYHDLLHFDRYVEPLIELIINPETETPFTIGIFGNWGTGKTTLLKMIESELKDKKYPIVFFDPWLHQSDENILLPLLYSFQEAVNNSNLKRIKHSSEKIATLVAKVATSILLKTVTFGQVSLKEIDEQIESYQKEKVVNVSTIRKLRDDLQGVVNALTDNGKNGRLILFIDNLDRCIPIHIIQLLESIKLFLDLENTIILIAMDKDIVQQGIQVFYKEFKLQQDEYDLLTSDYMDKMIQLPIYLHPLGSEQIENYINKLPVPLLHRIEHKELFSKCLHPNPRKIKRVINIYQFTKAIVERDGKLKKILKSVLLAKLIIIQQQWNDLYQQIVKHRELLPALEKVYKQDLKFSDDTKWAFANEKKNIIQELCKRYYHPSSLLAPLFELEGSFQDTNLDIYLYLLG